MYQVPLDLHNYLEQTWCNLLIPQEQLRQHYHFVSIPNHYYDATKRLSYLLVTANRSDITFQDGPHNYLKDRTLVLTVPIITPTSKSHLPKPK